MPNEPEYQTIQHTLNLLEEQAVPPFQDLFVDVAEKIKGLVTRRMQSGGLDHKFIDGLEVRGMGDFVPQLRGYLQSVYQAGQAAAQREAGTL